MSAPPTSERADVVAYLRSLAESEEKRPRVAEAKRAAVTAVLRRAADDIALGIHADASKRGA